MNVNELQAFLPRLQSQSLNEMIPARLCAYIRIYTALYDLVMVNGLDHEFGDRKIYLQKIEEAYVVLQQYTEQHPSAIYYHILLDLYDRYSAYHREIARHDIWERAVDYVEQRVAQHSFETSQSYYVCLHLISQLWNGIQMEEGEEVSGSLAFLQSQLSDWQQSQRTDVMWTDCSTIEILERLSLLIQNQESGGAPLSRTSNETLFKQQVQRSIQVIEQQALHPMSETELGNLLRFYDILQQFPYWVSKSTQALLLSCLEEQQQYLSESSFLGRDIVAIQIVQLCDQITSDYQQKIFDSSDVC